MIHVALCNNDASYISEIESLLHGIAMPGKAYDTYRHLL